MTLEQGRTDGYEYLRFDKADEARKLLLKGIIREGFNGFFDLPLKTPVTGVGFVEHPIGILVTEKRLWLTRLPFADGSEQIDLWPQFKIIDSSPKHALAFGNNEVRLERLIAQMIQVAGIEVAGSIIHPAVFEFYKLDIEQKKDKLSIKLRETAYPENFLMADLNL